MKKETLAIFTILLAACEGEPPKTAAGVTATVAAAPPPDPAAPSDDAPADKPAGGMSTSAHNPVPICQCNCIGGTLASADGGAPAAPAAGAQPAPAAPAAPAAPVTASVTGTVSSPKGPMANAVVYIDGLPVEPKAKMNLTITNKMMNFSPYIGVIPVGGKVTFYNADPFPHNVFTSDGEGFNMGMIPPNEGRQRVFKNAGAYSLLCNLHPGMLGYVVVAASSYYAKSDAQGRFTIKDVPPGTYKLTAWAPRLAPTTQSITVKDGDVSTTFELHR
jgi:plastocyanin